MGTDPWGFDLERQRLALELRAFRRRLSFARSAVTFAFLVVLLLGGSVGLRRSLTSLGGPLWAEAGSFLVLLYAAGFLLGMPFALLGLRLERRYGLSHQRTASWLADLGKSLGLGLTAVLASGLVLLWLLVEIPAWWWLAAWALGVLVSAVLGFVGPVLIAPLFFRFRTLRDPVLRARFEALAVRARVPILGVFEMNASAKTKRSNAAVAGFGRTRRVIVTDTMLVEFSPEEIESVLAHELGHQRHADPLSGLAMGALVSFLTLGTAALLYGAMFRAFGVLALGDMAGLPLLVFLASLVSTALGPPELLWSRRREARADVFSLELTQDPAAFTRAMVKLHDRNLSVSDPRRWEVWLLYSHPPGRDRVLLARAFAGRPQARGP